jgi:hypothetical protein
MSDTSTEPKATGTLETNLARKWVIKMAVFLVVSIGFGIYGLYDATIAYPNRGEKSASWHLYTYLAQADVALILENDLTVPEGLTAAEQYEEFENQLGDLTQSAEGTSLRAKADAAKVARYYWLGSLGVLGELTNERVAEDLSGKPRDTLLELHAKWQNADRPKPLASYDIPVQWLFTFIGLGGGAIMLIHMARIASKKYTWNAEELRLGLPGGASLVPADIEVFDRRKWDKFMIFLKVNAEHKELGGKEIKLDLYQYQPLEEWYTEMHKHARPEDFEDDNADESDNADKQEADADSQEERQPQSEG